MPDETSKVTLIRGDGSRIEATPEQADRLAILGYKPETNEQRLVGIQGSAEEDYYTSAGQQAQAGLEGFASGLTLTGSDYLGDKEGLAKRAQYNPGTRMGTEIVGALLPLVLSRGETGEASAAAITEEGLTAARLGEARTIGKAAQLAPTSLLSAGAEALAPGKTFSSAVLRGAFEGSVYGGLGAADHAYLDDSPLTAETVLHGIGWGALIGAGFGAAGHGISSLGEHEAGITQGVEAKNAAEKVRYEGQVAEAKAAVREPVPEGALKSQAEAPYQALKSEVASLSRGLEDTAAKAEASVKGTMDALFEGGRANDLAAFGESEPAFLKEVRSLESSFDKMNKAAEAGNFKAATEAQASYTSTATGIAKKLGMDLPSPGSALEEYLGSKMVGKELAKLPPTVEGFARMSPAKLERAAAALEQAEKLGLGNVDAIQQARTGLNEALGLAGDSELRATHGAAKTTLKYEGKPGVEYKEPKEPQTFGRDLKPQEKAEAGGGLLKSAAGYFLGGKAWVAAKGLGMGKVGAYTAFKSVKNAVTQGPSVLSALKAGVLGKVAKAAGEYLPAAGKQAAKAGGPVALATTIYGKPDNSSNDPKVLALNRIKELYNLAPTAPDTIYRALQPLSTSQPRLAQTMHAAALGAFQQLLSDAPKGTPVISKLQNIWKPSDVQAAVFAKQLAVFNAPVDEAIKMVENNDFDLIKAQALKKYSPEIWQNLRVQMLQRLTQPGVMDNMTYNDQIHLSVMLDLPIHSSMQPGNIASSQQIFLERRNLNSTPASPRMGQSGGMPNPSDNANATPAQRNELH